MIPKGGRYAKSVVNFIRKAPENWPKFKEAIQQIDDLLKQGKLKLDGKQKTIFESNKNILKNHEKVTKKVEVAPPVKKDPFLGWTPTLHQRSNLRNVYKDLDPPPSKYTKEMEVIDEELDALVFGGDKYRNWPDAEKAKLFKKLQADMKKLIDATKKEDVSTLSLSQINKKSHDLQKRIREIADNPNIKGTVSEGPKRDMIKAIYDSEHPGLTKAREIITKRNSELKYGKKYPVVDPENNMFIVIGLDERGNPIKIGRTIGKFSATKDKTTGELTSGDGMSFYDKWNAKTGTMRKEGEEVFTNTLNREGKEIMSNPDYTIPKTPNMDIQTEFYTNLSTSDLAKKGYKLKQIDMIRKGRKVREYLEKTQNPDVNIRMHEQTSTNDIGPVLEDLYHRGDDVYKMSMQEWVKKIPEYFAHGGSVPGFATGGISNLFREKFANGTDFWDQPERPDPRYRQVYKSLEDIPQDALLMMMKDPNFDLNTFLNTVRWSEPEETRFKKIMEHGKYSKEDIPWGTAGRTYQHLNYLPFGEKEKIGGVIDVDLPSDADKAQTIMHEMRHTKMDVPWFWESKAVPKWVRDYHTAGGENYLDKDIKDEAGVKGYRDTQQDVSGEELYNRYLDQYFYDVAEKEDLAGSDYKPYFDKILREHWEPHAEAYKEIIKAEKEEMSKPVYRATGGVSNLFRKR